jgi:dephospho-CoA kinase
MKLPKIIGIAGTNGSGKDTLGELLRQECGYITVSLSDILRAELTRRGQEHSRENLSGLSNELRQTYGDGVMTRRVFEHYGIDTKLCITSIRTPGEVDEMQKVGGVLVWVDADEQVRYERIQSGGRGRGATDAISFEEFQEQQAREMTLTAKGGGLNMAAVREKADIILENNFASLDAYQAYLRDYFEF